AIHTDGHPKKPFWPNNLGQSLSIRYRRFGDVTELERSISLLESAGKLTPSGHPKKPFWFNNLAGTFITRYERFGDVTDLERSISLFKDAVQLIGNGVFMAKTASANYCWFAINASERSST
ncbi:hypothetical protein OG21DRAFT_1515722, partial [Imleria badia]